MSKMTPAKGKDVVKVLQKIGFWIARWKGSHAIMDNGQRIVVVPATATRNFRKEHNEELYVMLI